MLLEEFNKSTRKLTLNDYDILYPETKYEIGSLKLYYSWFIPRIDYLYKFSKFNNYKELYINRFFYLNDPRNT